MKLIKQSIVLQVSCFTYGNQGANAPVALLRLPLHEVEHLQRTYWGGAAPLRLVKTLVVDVEGNLWPVAPVPPAAPDAANDFIGHIENRAAGIEYTLLVDQDASLFAPERAERVAAALSRQT